MGVHALPIPSVPEGTAVRAEASERIVRHGVRIVRFGRAFGGHDMSWRVPSIPGL